MPEKTPRILSAGFDWQGDEITVKVDRRLKSGKIDVIPVSANRALDLIEGLASGIRAQVKQGAKRRQRELQEGAK